jgi:hypothetical protein
MACAGDRVASVVSPVARADQISAVEPSVRATEWLTARVTVAMGRDATARLETAWRVMVLATAACRTSWLAWSKSNVASTRSSARSVTSAANRRHGEFVSVRQAEA